MSLFDDFLANHRRLERSNVPAAVELIIATAPFGADRQDRQRPRVPKNLLARIVDVISDQAAELESLRDRESQPVPRASGDPTVAAVDALTAALVILDVLDMQAPGETTVRLGAAPIRQIAQAVVDADPRVIADADEAGVLPTGSVIVDDSGNGPAWVIEEDSVPETWSPRFAGRKVRGVAGFGGVRYSVVYPAILIHTPTTTTTEGTPS